MFARFRRVESHLQVRLQVSIAESRRVDGKVRPEHIAALGSVGEPATIAARVAFWGQLHRRLAALSNRIGVDDQAKILGSIHARIPMVTIDEQRALQREKAEADEKFWACLQGMNESTAEGHKELADKASRIAAEAEASANDAADKAAAAKDRLDRLAKGEAISGGLGKPMTREDLIKAAGISESDARHMVGVAELTEGGFEEYCKGTFEAVHRH